MQNIEMSRIKELLSKLKQKQEVHGSTELAPLPDPTQEDLDKLKQALEDEFNSYEDEQVRIFMEYPEEIRELFLQTKREALVKDMINRMGFIRRFEPPIVQQMSKRFNFDAIAKVEREFRYKCTKTNLFDSYKRFESAHNDKIANRILLDDKDDK